MTPLFPLVCPPPTVFSVVYLSLDGEKIELTRIFSQYKTVLMIMSGLKPISLLIYKYLRIECCPLCIAAASPLGQGRAKGLSRLYAPPGYPTTL